MGGACVLCVAETVHGAEWVRECSPARFARLTLRLHSGQALRMRPFPHQRPSSRERLYGDRSVDLLNSEATRIPKVSKVISEIVPSEMTQ